MIDDDNGTTTSKRDIRGRWAKGRSGNPAGRSAGSRNKATLAMEALLEGAAERVTQRAIELAEMGDPIGLKLCLERLMPPCRARKVRLPCRKIDTAEGVRRAMDDVFHEVGAGRLTPAEGETLSAILFRQRQAIETEDLEQRVAQLEADRPKGRKAKS